MESTLKSEILNCLRYEITYAKASDVAKYLVNEVGVMSKANLEHVKLTDLEKAGLSLIQARTLVREWGYDMLKHREYMARLENEDRAGQRQHVENMQRERHANAKEAAELQHKAFENLCNISQKYNVNPLDSTNPICVSLVESIAAINTNGHRRAMLTSSDDGDYNGGRLAIKN